MRALSSRNIKGHRVRHMETLLPSLLTHPEKGCAIIYLIPAPSLLLGSRAPCTQPHSRPAHEHIVGPGGSAVDNLRRVHMAEQRAREEAWHAETKQVYDSEA